MQQQGWDGQGSPRFSLTSCPPCASDEGWDPQCPNPSSSGISTPGRAVPGGLQLPEKPLWDPAPRAGLDPWIPIPQEALDAAAPAPNLLGSGAELGSSRGTGIHSEWE